MIKLKDYDKEKQKISFVTDMEVSLANAIRRSVLEIPIMAIDEVEVIKNDSALYDEIIAHRLGLVPIKTEKASKEIKFKLKVSGPNIVTSEDIKPNVGTGLKIPITLIDKDQEIEMVCNANLGRGVEHIKYSPGLAFYKHNIDEDILDFVVIDNQGKITSDEEDLKNKGLSEEKIKKIKSFNEANELIFNIESWGQIEVKDIFTGAIDALESNLKELDKAVK